MVISILSNCGEYLTTHPTQSNSETVVLQQQKSTSGSIPVSQEQETTIVTGSLNLDSSRSEKKQAPSVPAC